MLIVGLPVCAVSRRIKKKNAVPSYGGLWQQHCNFCVTTSRKLTFFILNVTGRRSDHKIGNVMIHLHLNPCFP